MIMVQRGTTFLSAGPPQPLAELTSANAALFDEQVMGSDLESFSRHVQFR